MNSSRKAGRAAKLGALALGALLTLSLAGCVGSMRPTGSESDPLYSGELFETRTVIEFASGQQMECFELTDYSSSESLFCDWAKAPKANLMLKDGQKDWSLVFVELPTGTAVCLAKNWGEAPDKISCELNGIER